MPYKPPFNRNDRIDSLCMEIAELVGMIPSDAPLAKNPVLHRELRIKTIHSSLLIEGNTLGSDTVTAILDGKRVFCDSRDILEIENAKRAYDIIPELDSHSPEDLLLAHRTMMEGSSQKRGVSALATSGVRRGCADSRRPWVVLENKGN